MNYPLFILHLASLLVIAAAFVCLGCGWNRFLRRDARVFFTLLLGLFFLHHLSYTLEWGAMAKTLDVFEDYAGLLFPILWGCFFYAFMQETARQVLEEGESKYRFLIENQRDLLVKFDSRRRLLFVSPSCCKTFGKTEEELLGKDFLPLVHQDDRDRVTESLEDLSRPPHTCSHDDRVLTADGWRWFSWHDTALLDKEGRIEAVVAVGRDITRRRNAEAALQDSKDFLQAVIDAVPEALMVINRDYSVALANRTIIEMMGGEDPVCNCLKCHWVSHRRESPCEGSEYACPLEAVFETKTRVSEMHVHRDAGGREFHAEIIMAPVFDETGEVVRVIESIRDVTERVEAEKERRELEAEMLQAQKLESLGALAGGIAHDFNNLLMVVLGNADLALQDLSPDAPARGNIEEVEKAARRAAGLARQMLAYSGKGKFQIEPINLSEIVEEMAHLLEVSISKKTILKYDLARDLPLMEGDADQISQIVMNLITNASESIGENGGVVSVGSGVMECDRAYLSESFLNEKQPEGLYVYLEVADTGCGMDKDTMARVFDPFFTTKFTGRGLGLAAVLGIVRGHKGAIKVGSGVGWGSTFRVLFPVDRKNVAAAKEKKSATQESGKWTGKGTILLVDDEETVRTLGAKMLEWMGFSVLTAEDGRDGLDVFQAHADEIACVILDLTMPRMDGQECYHMLRRIRKDVPVILSSGYTEEDVFQRFEGKGLAGYIQKPYEAESLRAKLREALSR